MAAYKNLIAGRTCLYRAYAGEQLAYVGITRNLAGRLSKHAWMKPWWDDVTRVDIEWFDTRREAMEAEAAAITDEGPLHNVARPKVVT